MPSLDPQQAELYIQHLLDIVFSKQAEDMNSVETTAAASIPSASNANNAQSSNDAQDAVSNMLIDSGHPFDVVNALLLCGTNFVMKEHKQKMPHVTPQSLFFWRNPDTGYTVMHYLAALGADKSIALLVSSRFCPIEVRTEFGQTPLDVALEFGNRISAAILDKAATMKRMGPQERQLTIRRMLEASAARRSMLPPPAPHSVPSKSLPTPRTPKTDDLNAAVKKLWSALEAVDGTKRMLG